MTQAYPLQWPAGRPRATSRKIAPFGARDPKNVLRRISLSQALGRLQAEVDRLGARDYVLSSNLALRLDGRPRADQGNPSDPGVALYFSLRGEQHCLPCDTFTTAADNIAALAAHIEATRKIERYGVASVKEMFTGFVALPPPTDWRRVLGFLPQDKPSASEIGGRYRVLAKERQGNEAALRDLNVARDEALREVEA